MTDQVDGTASQLDNGTAQLDTALTIKQAARRLGDV